MCGDVQCPPRAKNPVGKIVALKPMHQSFIKAGAEEGTRTPTVLPPPGPEPGASTNSATSALAFGRGLNRTAFYLKVG